MLTAVPFPSLKLEKLIPHPILDSSASLIGCHVVHHLRAELESGTFLIGHVFQC